MPLLSTDRPPAPTALLAELRRSRTADGAQYQQTLDAWGLHPLTGERNNHFYSWTGPASRICIKIYKLDDRRRAPRPTSPADHRAGRGRCDLWLLPAAQDVLPVGVVFNSNGTSIKSAARIRKVDHQAA